MVWLDSSPRFLAPYVEDEPPLSVQPIPNTPLLAVLTATAISIYHQYTLVQLNTLRRTRDSLTQHGKNVAFLVQSYSINHSKLQQVAHANIFVQSANTHITLYLGVIDYSKLLFQVVDGQSDELLQQGLPLLKTTSLFSLSNLLKTATRSIVTGADHTQNLQNIEHFNDFESEDEANNFTIPYVKLSTIKILKVAIGIDNFWLKHNSHNLFIYNKGELQVINVKTFHSENFRLDALPWYKSGSRICQLCFNGWFNYFLMFNEDGECWFMSFNEEKELEGYKVVDNAVDAQRDVIQVHFNPQSNQFLLQSDTPQLQLMRTEFFDHVKVTLIKLIDLPAQSGGKISISWSPCGEFFTLVHEANHHWLVYSSLGNCVFNSGDFASELSVDFLHLEFNFLKAGLLLILPSSSSIVIFDADNSTIYMVDLLRRVSRTSSLLMSSEYMHILNNNQTLKVGIPPHFKNIIRRLHQTNNPQHSSHGKNCLPGRLTAAISNDTAQLSLSFGDNLSVSTSYRIDDTELVHHVLWFNFQNLFMETINIIDHFWYSDYLIVINRNYDEDENLFDEVIILNASLTKFGASGINVKFNSDTIIWRHKLKGTVVCHHLQKIGDTDYVTLDDFNGKDLTEKSTRPQSKLDDDLIVVTNDARIIIFRLFFAQENSAGKSDLSIGIKRTIFLKSISQRLITDNVIQISFVDQKHFLILSNTGQLYALTSHADDGNIYDLTLIHDSVSSFETKRLFVRSSEETGQTYICLYTGHTTLIYTLADVVAGHQALVKASQQICIPLEDHFQPLCIDTSKSKSIILVGLQNYASYKSKHMIIKLRTNHKLVLNDFIEHDLLYKKDLKHFKRYEIFDNFHYSLELLLFKYLTNIDNNNSNSAHDDNSSMLKDLIGLINTQPNLLGESIYVNCLRKIEVGFWSKFFDILDTTPLKFMNKLILIGKVELCYNYLIIYLNFKKEYEAPVQLEKKGPSSGSIDLEDYKIILSILVMLDKAQRWDWCFELCRFIKLLDSSGELLRQIELTLTATPPIDE